MAGDGRFRGGTLAGGQRFVGGDFVEPKVQAWDRLSAAVLDGVLGARIEHHIKLSLVDLVSLGHLDGVSSGQDARPQRRAKNRAGSGRDMWRLQAHVPHGAIDAAMLAAGNHVNQLALRVESARDLVCHERTVLVVPDVVFPTGIVETGHSYLVYYGAADCGTAVVEFAKSEVLKALG